MRMMIKDILVKNGFDVVGEAENGAQAVEKFKETSPDLVTMDITMPEMDGITALKEIKQIDRFCKNHHVFCNGRSNQWLLTRSKQEQKTLS